MHKLIIAAAAAFAAPAFAQPPAYDDRIEDEIQRAIPPAEQVEAMAPTLDRMMGVLLNVDVGPLIDAADPYRRRADHGRRGRTLGDSGGRGRSLFPGSHALLDLRGHRGHGPDDAGLPFRSAGTGPVDARDGGRIGNGHGGLSAPRSRAAPGMARQACSIPTTDFPSREHAARSRQMTGGLRPRVG